MKRRFSLIAFAFCFALGLSGCRTAAAPAGNDAAAPPADNAAALAGNDAAAPPADNAAASASAEESGEVLPRTPEEAAMMERIIMDAQYDEVVRLCAGKKVDFGAKARYPLLFAAVERYPQNRDQYFLERKVRIMKFMLENGGADLVRTDIGFLCVEAAVQSNNKEVFDLFLQYGYNLNMKDAQGKTVLDYALAWPDQIDPEIMNKLQSVAPASLFSLVRLSDAEGLRKALQDKENLEAINKWDSRSHSLLYYAAESGKNPYGEQVFAPAGPDVFRVLLEAGADPAHVQVASNGDSGAALLFIVWQQRNDLLPVLWEFRDKLPEEEWKKGLAYAARHENAGAFRFFLEKGFDPMESRTSSTPDTVETAYMYGPKEIVDMLDRRGLKKPFWAAARWNDLELAKEYIAAGTDVNARVKLQSGSAVPFRLAVQAGQKEMVELLLDNGAYVAPEDYFRNRMTYPLDIAAAMQGGEAMTRLLLERGFTPDHPVDPNSAGVYASHDGENDARLTSSLYIALDRRHFDTARILVEFGARKDVTLPKEYRLFGTSFVDLHEYYVDDPDALAAMGEEKGFFDYTKEFLRDAAWVISMPVTVPLTLYLFLSTPWLQ
ncbi:MAG: hypothetical protein IKQ16_02605 [Lentisphaeria bacterium]|nr:hypothetical protein [Lentisphaeria bacterium]